MALINGNGGDNLLNGTVDADTINGNGGNDTIYGLGGDDSITALGGNDYIEGGDGNDSINAQNGTDTVYGGLGNDTLSSSGPGSLYGEDGDDYIYVGAGGAGYGGIGSDTLSGGSTGSVYGEAGNDTLYGGGYVDGGADDDDILVTWGSTGGTIHGGDGNDSINGNASFDLHVYGDDGDDYLYTNSATGTFEGGLGNDTLEGSYFDTTVTLAGGEGDDFYDLTLQSSNATSIIENPGEGDDSLNVELWSMNAFTNPDNVEHLNINAVNANGGVTVTGSDGSDDISLIGNTHFWTVNGGLGNDTLDAGDRIAVLNGEDGDDVLTSSYYATLNGGMGNDTLTAAFGSASTTLDGGDGDDVLVGSNNTEIYGGAGNDTIYANDYAQVWAGDGNDTIYVDNTPSDNSFLGEAGNDTFILADGFTYSGWSYPVIAGGAGDDVYDIGSDTNWLQSWDGYVYDPEQDDWVLQTNWMLQEEADGGTDTLIVRGIDFTMPAIANIEILEAHAGDGQTLTINGSGGNDHIVGVVDSGSASFVLQGGNGNDTLQGGSGNDSLAGGAGNDVYLLSGGTDTLVEDANGGFDTVVVRDSSYTLTAANIEAVSLEVTTSGADLSILGNAENNQLQVDFALGAVRNVTLNGGMGDDTLIANGAMDELSTVSLRGGLTGNDTFVIGSNTGVEILDNSGTDTVIVTGIDYSLASLAYIENLTGEAHDGQNLTLTGNDADNEIRGNLLGGEASFSMVGGLGNDSLYAASAFDTLAGGNGDDVYFVGAFGGTVTIQEDIGGGTDFIGVTDNFTLGSIANIEGVKGYAVSFLQTITLTGNDDGNTLMGIGMDWSSSFVLQGGSGNDTLLGSVGNDTLDGGLGTNFLFGGEGNDTLIASGNGTLAGGFGNDTYDLRGANNVSIVENLDEGWDDTILINDTDFSLDVPALANIESLRVHAVSSTATLTLTGNAAHNDILAFDSTPGGDARFVIDGGAGDDYIIAYGMKDTLTGGEGDDSLYSNLFGTAFGENGDDYLQAANAFGGDGNDAIYAYSSTQGKEVKAFGGDGNDEFWVWQNKAKLYGGNGDDTIWGGYKKDVLVGGGGNDVLIGGPQEDTLTGGGGRDKFVLDSFTRGFDTITDFQSGKDQLYIRKSETDLTWDQFKSGDYFALGSSAADADDRLVYDQTSGALYYDPDGSGAASQYQIAQLGTGGVTLDVSDVKMFNSYGAFY